MATHAPRSRLFRAEGVHRVTTMELFFDLVYVFAITQLSHLLLENLDWHGAFQTALLLLAVWWAWVYTTWATNWFDPDQLPVRVVLMGVMAASLIVSTVIPEAFGERGLLFAVAFVALQVGRTAFVAYWSRRDPVLGRNFLRILAWLIASGVLWVAGGLSDGTTREVLWLGAVAIDYIAPAAGFWIPVHGRSSTRDWNISGAHMAERCQLFLIIALGESILITGRTFGESEISPIVVAGFMIAFLGSVALWWVYFDRAAGDAEHMIAQSDDPGRLGRLAYTYLHLPMIAGIIVTAVGDELAIAHPLGHAGPGIAATVLGGPAIFLFGHLLFKRAVFEVWSLPRIAAIVVLVVMAFGGQDLPPIVLASVALVVIASVPVLDARMGPREHSPLMHGGRLAE